MDEDVKQEALAHIHRRMKGAGKRIDMLRIGTAAAILLLPLLMAWGAYRYGVTRLHAPATEQFVVMAEDGQKTKILLPDGTFVWLNSESQLIYSADFNRNNRRVKLRGEAFFEVGPNTDARFTVEAEGVDIVVYGTAFNVSAYPTDSVVNIALLRGKIALENNATHHLLTGLSPNQLSSFIAGAGRGKRGRKKVVTQGEDKVVTHG